MKRIVPSTACSLRVVLWRDQFAVRVPTETTKFGYVRERLNGLLEKWDDPANRVTSVDIYIKIGAQT